MTDFSHEPRIAEAQLMAHGFVRAISGALRLDQVEPLTRCRLSFPWTDRNMWGIDEQAWSDLDQAGIDPLVVFCHPRVISEQPRLLAYYRKMALLSRKAFASLIKHEDIAGIEAGRVERIDAATSVRFVIAINSILSAFVQAGAKVGLNPFTSFQFAAAGATVQGSWNNAVGTSGEEAVKTILANHLREEILHVVWKDSTVMEYEPGLHATLIDRIGDVRVIRLKQGFHIVFGSEPDASLRDPKDLPLIAIEVKAGTDPAGALERLGAAMKSFDNERSLNPRVKTVYVVRALTPEVQRRISQGKPFDYTFGLSDLLADEKTQKVFANLVLRTVLGK